MEEREVGRQLIHLTGISVLVFAYFLGKTLIGYASIFIGLIILFLSEYYKEREEFKKKLPFRIRWAERLEGLFYNFINSLEREEYLKKRPYLGAFTFYFMAGITLLLFPKPIAFLSIAVLSVGDSVSTLIGVHYGKHSLFLDRNKTWEGFIGGVLGSLLVCWFIAWILPIPIEWIILAPIIGMFVEGISRDVNDNILIPLVIGVILSLV